MLEVQYKKIRGLQSVYTPACICKKSKTFYPQHYANFQIQYINEDWKKV